VSTVTLEKERSSSKNGNGATKQKSQGGKRAAPGKTKKTKRRPKTVHVRSVRSQANQQTVKGRNLLVRDLAPARLPLWRESFTGIDWLRLHASKVYYGFGIPHGTGAPVILVPGFMTTDSYLIELYAWLVRIGYKPYLSKIGRNADCPHILANNLVHTVHKAHRETRKPVHLIGHSLGGVLARNASVRVQDQLASVIALGAPIRGVRVHPMMLYMHDLVHKKIHLSQYAKPLHLRPQSRECFRATCRCSFAQTWRTPLPDDIAFTSIYTKKDGVVDWKVCKSRRPDANFEVTGTHCGLAFNPESYQVIAERLHWAEEMLEHRKAKGKRKKRKRNG
jgi:pimeloyl-ACP methyl ester carboxylesterase